MRIQNRSTDFFLNPGHHEKASKARTLALSSVMTTIILATWMGNKICLQHVVTPKKQMDKG